MALVEKEGMLSLWKFNLNFEDLLTNPERIIKKEYFQKGI